MENIETGLLLMGVGMTTVFFILLIVINFGKLLIAFVNKYAPEEAPKKQFASSSPSSLTEAIPATTLTAIVSAVSVATGGKGKVIKVEKM